MFSIIHKKIPSGYYKKKQKNKYKLQKEARERYQNLSEENKNKKRKCARKGIKIFLNKKKTKSENVANAIKIYPNMENKSYSI